MQKENSLIPTSEELQVVNAMAKTAFESQYFNKLGGLAGVTSIAHYARELGIPVMTALFGGMQNIQGKITIAPQLMNGMIRRAGHKLKIESNDDKCVITGTRQDTGESASASFSVEEAKKAGIYKPNGPWEKYPSDMCFARALSRLARRLFPDVIGMMYVEGEIESDAKNKPTNETENLEAEIADKIETISLDEALEIEKKIENSIAPIDPGYRQRALIGLKISNFEDLPKKLLSKALGNISKKIEEIKVSEFSLP